MDRLSSVDPSRSDDQPAYLSEEWLTRRASLTAALAAYEEAPSAARWDEVRTGYTQAVKALSESDQDALWADVKKAQQARRATGATADCLVFDRYQRLRRANWDKTLAGRAKRQKVDKKRAATPERQAALREYRRAYKARQKAAKAEQDAILATVGVEK